MASRILKQNIEAEILVQSESHEGAYYLVILNENGWFCSCPLFQNRNRTTECKHIKEAKEVIKYD